jgi:hypothetical protein
MSFFLPFLQLGHAVTMMSLKTSPTACVNYVSYIDKVGSTLPFDLEDQGLNLSREFCKFLAIFKSGTCMS